MRNNKDLLAVLTVLVLVSAAVLSVLLTSKSTPVSKTFKKSALWDQEITLQQLKQTVDSTDHPIAWVGPPANGDILRVGVGSNAGAGRYALGYAQAGAAGDSVGPIPFMAVVTTPATANGISQVLGQARKQGFRIKTIDKNRRYVLPTPKETQGISVLYLDSKEKVSVEIVFPKPVKVTLLNSLALRIGYM